MHPTRRGFMNQMGLGFSSLALDAMLHADEAHSPPDGRPHHAPKAKAVLWIFLSGGYSHLETFDPKPALTRYAGKTFQETPFPNPLTSPLHARRSRSVIADDINIRDTYSIVYPTQIGFKKHGQSGIEISDWFPHLARRVDDLCFVRNMYTTDNDHAAENQMHTGRHRLDEVQPSVGAWVHYGLGRLSDNLPQFLVLGGPTRADTAMSLGSQYLGPQHAGVPLALDPTNPLPNGRRSPDVLAEEQANEFGLIGRLNELAAVNAPEDQNLRARIEAYQLAYRMQTAVPEALNLPGETEATRRMYGIDQPATHVAGERLLAARRLIERGVRFVQVYPNSYGSWDSHRNLRGNHALMAGAVDKPVAGLMEDLKRRGLLDDVTVVFCTEFGRTPGLEQRSGGRDGRDHHPHGFTVWLAGAGIKRGHVHGETDELGFHAQDPAHYVTDLHATVLHLLGLDPRRLEVPGRRRLAIDFGQPILDILT